MIAARTGGFHKFSGDEADGSDCQIISAGAGGEFMLERDYTREDPLRIIEGLIDKERILDWFIDRNKLRCMRITYENIMDSCDYLAGVADFAGIDGATSPRQRDILRLSNELNDGIRQLFEKQGGLHLRAAITDMNGGR